VTREDVLAALRTVQEPELGRDIVSLNMVTDIRIENGAVHCTIVLTTAACPLQTEIKERCAEAVRRLPDVKNVEVAVTAAVTRGVTLDRDNPLPSVKNITAVSSVKGGVGKSTVAVTSPVGVIGGTKVSHAARLGPVDKKERAMLVSRGSDFRRLPT
jgi:ATP-binding protein involved in chromosome partitioning